jgi:hypothetical protein
MKRLGAAVVLSALGAGVPAAAQTSLEIRIDTRPAREILGTLTRPKFEPSDAKVLEDMPAIELSIRDSARDRQVFERDLGAAFDRESRVAVFDFRSVREQAERWSALVAVLDSKSVELSRMAVSRASAVLPADRPVAAKLTAAFSFGLAGLADHIVAKNPDGGELLVVDLRRAVADSEGEPPEARLARLASLIAGEAFRQAWGIYRAGSPAWKSTDIAPRPFETFLRTVAEAGPVALFSVDEAFFPLATWLKDLQKKSFNDLQRAAEHLAESDTELEKRVEVLGELKKPDFVNRVASPAGMFMADGIRQVAGPEGLKAAMAGGPHAFFEAYDRASQKNKELLQLSKLLKERLAAAAKAAPKP